MGILLQYKSLEFEEVTVSMFEKREIKKLSLAILIGVLVVLISIVGSASLVLNTDYFETGILKEQSEKYQYIGDDITTQISTAVSVFAKLEANEEMIELLTTTHISENSVNTLYQSIDFSMLLENMIEEHIYEESMIYSTNPTISFMDKFEYTTNDIENEEWYIRINESRRNQTLAVIDSNIYVLYKMEFSDNPNQYKTIGFYKLDNTVFETINLKNYEVMVKNTALDTNVTVAGEKNLTYPYNYYINVFESGNTEDEMILLYDIVPGTTLSRWSLIIVTDQINFLAEFAQYAVLIFAILLVIISIVLSRFSIINKVNKSFAQLSQEELQLIIASNKPSKIERIIKNLYEKVETLVQQNQELNFINQQKEAQKNEAEIKALLSQISPHYIFNLLNSIHKRALKNNEMESAKMILLMSKQLRRSLEWKEPFVTIKDEIDHINSYIALQQYYYGTQCDFNYDIDETLFPIKIPKLIFQTLIENALKHGVKTSPFYIQLKQKDDFISFSVTNEVLGKTKDVEYDIANVLFSARLKEDGEGIGLTNMIKRLEYYYNDNYKVYTQKYKHNVSITIVLPKLV